MKVKIRRRQATKRCDAFQPSPSGCGGRRDNLPRHSSLTYCHPVRLRRRSSDLAAWRSQRGSREVLKGALKCSPLAKILRRCRTTIERCALR